jgi:hypothetical protein
MSPKSYGSGTLFQRGENWYVSYWVNRKQRQQSLRTTDRKAAQKERDRIIGQRASGEMDSLLAQRMA